MLYHLMFQTQLCFQFRQFTSFIYYNKLAISLLNELTSCFSIYNERGVLLPFKGVAVSSQASHSNKWRSIYLLLLSTELREPPLIQTMYQIIDGMASFHSLFSSECSYDCRNAASYWWRCKRALREFNATAYTSKKPHEKNHVNEYVKQRDDD